MTERSYMTWVDGRPVLTRTNAPKTEDQVERMAERRMDGLDARLMSGALSQAEYDSLVRDLDCWVRQQLVRTVREQ